MSKPRRRDGGERAWPRRWRESDVEHASPEERLLREACLAAEQDDDTVPDRSPNIEWARFQERLSRRDARRVRARVAMSAAAVAAALLLFFMWRTPGPELRPGPQGERALAVAQAAHVGGLRNIAIHDESKVRTLAPVAPGGVLELPPGAQATADIEGSIHALLRGGAQVAVLPSGDAAERLRLSQGEIVASVDPEGPRTLVILTSEAEVRVTGTVFAVRAAGRRTEVTVWRGSVVVTWRGRETRVGAGEHVVFGGRAPGGDDDGDPQRRPASALQQADLGLLRLDPVAARGEVTVRSLVPAPAPTPVTKPVAEAGASRPEPAEHASPRIELDAVAASQPGTAPRSVRRGHHLAPEAGARVASTPPPVARAPVLERAPHGAWVRPSASPRPTAKGGPVERTAPREALDVMRPELPATPLRKPVVQDRAPVPAHPSRIAQSAPAERPLSQGPRLALHEREQQLLALSRGADESAGSALFALGALRHDALGSTRAAIEAWQDYVRRFPRGALVGEAHAALFEAFIAIERPSDGIAHVEAALPLIAAGPRRRALRLAAAELLHLDLDEARRAVEHYRLLLDGRDARGERASFLIASAYQHSGANEEARAALETYLARYPHGRYRAQALEALGSRRAGAQ